MNEPTPEVKYKGPIQVEWDPHTESLKVNGFRFHKSVLLQFTDGALNKPFMIVKREGECITVVNCKCPCGREYAAIS